jgi:hypothetical protein
VVTAEQPMPGRKRLSEPRSTGIYTEDNWDNDETTKAREATPGRVKTNGLRHQ